MDTGEPGRVFGGLALRIVEIGWHGDDRAVQVCVEAVFCALAQRGQDLGADLHRRLHAVRRGEADHAALPAFLHEVVGQLVSTSDVGQGTPHKTLGGGHGVARVLRLGQHSLVADLATTALQVAHHRRQQQAALGIGQAFGYAALHGGHQGMRGAQVNADRDAPLVRVGGLAGLGNLQKRHGI